MTNRQAESLKKAINRHFKEAALGPAADVEVLAESFAAMADAILKMEDEGWSEISGLSHSTTEKGLSLEDVKKITEYAERQTKTNNLLGRGLRLKNNYTFGRGYRFIRPTGEEIQPRFQKIIDDPENQDVVFGEAAIKELNRVLYTSGNLLVIVNQKTKKITRMSVASQVANYIAYDDDPTRVKYWKRTYTRRNDLSPGAQPQVINEWIPTWQYKDANPNLPPTVNVGGTTTEPVNQECVIVDLRVNKDDGEIYGVPDCLSALPWAWAATEYLKDGSKLMKALATIAYHVKAKTLAAANSAGAKVQSGKIGSAAITGPDTEITQLPRAGAINLYEGRPLQAAVANALDVSVSALTSDSGTGGSYASESALSQPEQLAVLSRQSELKTFFGKLFRALGAQDIQIDFARVDIDPIHRRLQSLGLSRTLGGINQQEFRDASLELLDVAPTTTTLPKPDEFTGSKYSTLKKAVDAELDAQKNEPEQTDADGNPIPSQGNSGAVGSLDDNGNDARNSDRDSTAS